LDLKDNINFIDKGQFEALFNIFGWQVREVKTYRDWDVIRADFYPVGYVLGFSKKAIIICDGSMRVIHDGETFTDFEQMVQKYGEKAYETFPDWDVLVEKQWAIKKEGEWVAAFSNLSELPYSKQVKC